MKVAKRKSDGLISYRQEPEFEVGYGILNSVRIHGGVEADYEEVEITQEDWDYAIENNLVILM